jgi:hypothetical protein
MTLHHFLHINNANNRYHNFSRPQLHPHACVSAADGCTDAYIY